MTTFLRHIILVSTIVFPLTSFAQEAERKVHSVEALLTKGKEQPCSSDPTEPYFPFCKPPKSESYAHFYITCTGPMESDTEMTCRSYPFVPNCIVGVDQAVKVVQDNGCSIMYMGINGVLVSPPFDEAVVAKACDCPPS